MHFLDEYLTSIANYKKGEKFTHGMSVQGKGCVQVRYPNIQQESLLCKKNPNTPGAKSQVLRNTLFSYSESTR